MSNTYGDGSEQSLGHVSHNDTDKEDDSIQPVVTQNERNDEERDSEEHGYSGNDVDEMSNLLSNWSLTSLQSRSQVSDTSHHCAVTCKITVMVLSLRVDSYNHLEMTTIVSGVAPEIWLPESYFALGPEHSAQVMQECQQLEPVSHSGTICTPPGTHYCWAGGGSIE